MKLDSKFTCPDCKAQYQIEGKFKKHLADVHGNGKKDSICTYCEKVLSSTRALERHLKSHKKCNDCKAEFDSISEANDHKKTHTTCGICKYDFKSKSNLKRHMKDFHEQIVWFDFMSALYCLLVCFIASTILSASYALLPIICQGQCQHSTSDMTLGYWVLSSHVYCVCLWVDQLFSWVLRLRKSFHM